MTDCRLAAVSTLLSLIAGAALLRRLLDPVAVVGFLLFHDDDLHFHLFLLTLFGSPIRVGLSVKGANLNRKDTTYY
jgi:hypothetical protein